MSDSKSYCPINLRLEGKRCTVVGGGHTANRKIRKIAAAGARLTIVATKLREELAWPSGVEFHIRPYSSSDLIGSSIVVAATNSYSLNRQITKDARTAGILVLNTDSADDSDFILSASLYRDNLSVSFSTNGLAPHFSAWLRKKAESMYTDAHGRYCNLLKELREYLHEKLTSTERKRFYKFFSIDNSLAEFQRFGIDAFWKDAHAAIMLIKGESASNVLAFPKRKPGRVYLVGAGPGDPALITVRAAECLRKADVVLFDALVNPVLMQEYAVHAEHIGVRKRKGNCEKTQEETTQLLIQLAKRGKTVVRLKGGDPITFGRGAEEAVALKRAGIPYALVPGVSCIASVPACAGIPVTHREHASSFGVYSAHRRDGLTFSDEQWRSIVKGPDTKVLLMGKTRCREIMNTLVLYGLSAQTPAAIIYNGSLPNQYTITGTVETLPALAEAYNDDGPALIVIGQVVSVRQDMSWMLEAARQQEAAR